MGDKREGGVVGVKGASNLEQIFSFVGLRTTKISAFVLHSFVFEIIKLFQIQPLILDDSEFYTLREDVEREIVLTSLCQPIIFPKLWSIA